MPTRRELSFKKQDPPYRLMDVLASMLSDLLSCWLHQRVQREWQINYTNEANLHFLSWRAAVWQLCVALSVSLLSLSLYKAGMSPVLHLFLLPRINPCKLTQGKELFCMGEVKSEAFIECKCHRNCSRLAKTICVKRGSALSFKLFQSY